MEYLSLPLEGKVARESQMRCPYCTVVLNLKEEVISLFQRNNNKSAAVTPHQSPPVTASPQGEAFGRKDIYNAYIH